jgi:hypothetical protein
MGRRLLRNSLWSAAVLGVVAGLGFGLPAVNDALPAAKPIPTDRPYLVGGGISVVPPPGAQLDVTKTVPGGDRGTALFVIGGIRYAIVVVPFAGSLASATSQFRTKITATRGYQVTGKETPTRTAQGVTGLQGGYSSPGRDGRYAVFLSEETAVEVTFAGVDLELHGALAALETSVASIAFGAAQ